MTKRRPAPRDSYRPDTDGGDRDRRGRSRERTPPPLPLRARDSHRRESPPKTHERDGEKRRERSRSVRRGRDRERSIDGSPLDRDRDIIRRRERPDDRDLRRRTPSPLSKRKRSPSPRQQKRVKKRRNRKGRPESLERRRPDISPPRHRSPGRRHDPRDPRSGRDLDRGGRGIRRRSRSPTKSRADPANDLSRFFEAPRPPSPAGSAPETRKKRETTPVREPGSPPKRRRLSRSPRRERERSPPRRERSSRHGRESPPRRDRSPHGDRTRRRESPRPERPTADRRGKEPAKNGTKPNPLTPDDEKKEKEKELIKEKEKVLDPEFQARFQPISQVKAVVEATESEQPTLEIPTGPAADRNARPGSVDPSSTNAGPKDRGWGLQIQTPFEIANSRPPPSQPRAFRQPLFNINSSTTISVQSQVQTPVPPTPQPTGFIKPPPTGPALAAQSQQFHHSMRGRHGFAVAVPMRGRGGMQKVERGMGRGGYAIKTSMAPAAQQIQIAQAYEMAQQQEIIQEASATMEVVVPEQQQQQTGEQVTQMPHNIPTGPSNDGHGVTFRPFSLGLNKKPSKPETPTRPQQQQHHNQHQHQSHRKAEPPRNAPRGPRGSDTRSATNTIVAHVRARAGRGNQQQQIGLQQSKTAAPPAPKPPPKPRPPVKHYERISVVGEGTYGKVYKARNTFTGSLVALKKLRMEGERDGFPVTAVREMKLLQSLRHENILCLYEMMVENNACYMVFEYMDHDLTGILKHPTFHLPPGQIKHLAQQFFCGLQYLHHRGVLHRDLKNSNILVSADGILKIADFGLARPYSKRKKGLDYTNRIITLWYRPPEVLLGATQYGPAVDIWSAGCVFIEFFTQKAIFQGRTDIDQLDIIYDVLGTPAKDDWPSLTTMPWYNLLKTPVTKPSRFRQDFGHLLSPRALELVEWTFNYDPENRPTAEQVLQHAYFTEELPLAEPPIGLRDLQGDWHEYEAKSRERKLREKEKEEKRAAAAAAVGQ